MRVKILTQFSLVQLALNMCLGNYCRRKRVLYSRLRLCVIWLGSSGALTGIAYQVRLIIHHLVLLEQICVPKIGISWQTWSLRGKGLVALWSAGWHLHHERFRPNAWSAVNQKLHLENSSASPALQGCPWQWKQAWMTKWQILATGMRYYQNGRKT